MKILGIEITKNLISFLLGLGVIIFVFLFLITTNQIRQSVEDHCEFAQSKYHKDCVESLIMTLEDEGNGFANRNSAIWSLGQLGDKRALEVLKKYYTGDIPDKEPWDGVLSQYELKKAINLLEGGVNLGAWAWRAGEFFELDK